MKKSIVLCFALLLMLFHADYVTEGARYGLLLWYTAVVPALFPFMVLSGLIVAGGGVAVLMTPVYLLLGCFLPISKNGCYVLVSGLLCGYPMGAKTCADFVREGRISLNEGKFLMAICNHPSPMFLLGYMYPFFAEDLGLGKLLAAVYGPVLILALAAKRVWFPRQQAEVTSSSALGAHRAAGFAYRAPGAKSSQRPAPPQTSSDGRPGAMPPAAPSPQSADETILSAVEILCKIGGYLMLFSILIVFLRHTPWLPVPLRLFLIGAMEMTTGIQELAASLPCPLSAAAAIAALTFGGFSGLFQTRAVISGHEKKAGLSIRQYFFWKLLHAALSAGSFLLMYRFL